MHLTPFHPECGWTQLHRYDLLCIEGISRALRVFLGVDKAPNYRLVYPQGGEANLLTVTVAPEVREPEYDSGHCLTTCE